MNTYFAVFILIAQCISIYSSNLPLCQNTTNNIYSTENFIMSRVICHIIKSICIDIQIKMDIESIF